MSNLAVSNPYRPFSDINTFQYGFGFMELADLGCAARVCKFWNSLIQSSFIWKNLFKREGIPLVVSLNGGPRNYKEDFKVLYPITAVSGSTIGQLFGKIVGLIPPISEKWFNKLQEEDPFEKGKSIKENYVVVVDPSLIKRTVDDNTPLSLDESGNLIVLSKEQNQSTEAEVIEKRDLTIPFSLRNYQLLCSDFMNGKKNTPVFTCSASSSSRVFNCDVLDKTRVYFMRKHIVPESKECLYSQQEEFVKSRGFEVTSLRQRALLDFTLILQHGTCHDVDHPLTYARTSDITRCCGSRVSRPLIGNFTSDAGVVIFDHDDGKFYCVGVVPVVSVEALST